MEIERKFLVDKEDPNVQQIIKTVRPIFIAQHYLSKNPEVRIRKERYGTKCFSYHLTIKSPISELVRHEVEIPITETDYQNLQLLSIGKVLKKRYIYRQNNTEFEIDIYSFITDLCTVEVEFLTEEDAKNFTPPHWFGKEVTNDPRYKNFSLAMNGVLKD